MAEYFYRDEFETDSENIISYDINADPCAFKSIGSGKTLLDHNTLNRSSEYKLFDKFNCLKYLSVSDPDSYSDRALETRALIVEFNVRSCWFVISKVVGNSNYNDELMGDCLVWLVHIVDRFNPYLGFRFGTYLFQSLSANIRRKHKFYKSSPSSDHCAPSIDRHDYFMPVDMKDEYDTVRSVIDSCLTDQEKYILFSRYGLEGHNQQSLISLGEHYRVTKERIRQIQRKAEDKIRYFLHLEEQV